MGKKQLDTRNKGIIEGMFRSGRSPKEISDFIGYSVQTVRHWIRRCVATNNMDRQEGSGRPRITTERTDRHILIIAKSNRFMHANEIRNAVGCTRLSDNTIIRRIKESGEFGFYRTVKKCYVSETNRLKRKAFAKKYINMPVEFWRRVVFTDESPFTFRNHNRRMVIRTKEERNKAFAMTGTVKHDKKINVWGGFCAHGVGRFHRIVGTMDKEMFKQILVHQVRPTLWSLFPDGNFIFQQDNDPKHTSRVCKDYVARARWEVLDWPSQSPDLNPIENLWAILDAKLRERRPQNEEELYQTLKEGWERLDVQLLTRLVDSMPNRLRQVLENDGLPISY